MPGMIHPTLSVIAYLRNGIRHCRCCLIPWAWWRDTKRYEKQNTQNASVKLTEFCWNFVNDTDDTAPTSKICFWIAVAEFRLESHLLSELNKQFKICAQAITLRENDIMQTKTSLFETQPRSKNRLNMIYRTLTCLQGVRRRNECIGSFMSA